MISGGRASIWSRIMLAVAPRWYGKRSAARSAARAFRHYEAAASSRRTDGWYSRSTDANAALTGSLSRLRNLSRDLRRNNGWARQACRVIVNNTIGPGIKAKALGGNDVAAMAAWNRWSRRNSCDYDGMNNFAGLQALVMRTVVESGEALVLKHRARARDGMAIPLRIRVLEPDWLDTYKDGMSVAGGGYVSKGVEFDSRGHRVAYWLYTSHPGSSGLAESASRFESRRVPASDVLHIYDVDRAGQHRGVPWLTAAIAKLNDFDDYDDALLVQQKVAACFAAFVRDVEGTGAALGSEDDTGEADPSGVTLDVMRPGLIEHLPPGKDIEFASPPQNNTHEGFSKTTLRRIAVTMGITYEEMTGDYEKVNFSSARMARLAHQLNVGNWRETIIIPMLLIPIWDWAMTELAGLNGWSEVPDCEWTPPPLPMIDPSIEGRANNDAIRSGQKTLPQVLRESGRDPDQHLAEYAKTLEILDSLGIKLDCDPRAVAANGQAQPVFIDAQDDATS